MKPDCQKYLQLLRKMIATPSLSFEEEAVCFLIDDFLTKEGIRHAVVNGNILALNEQFDPKKKTLALDAHIDTVPAAASYTRDPYDAGNDEDTIWGLGSNDDGGSVVSMTAAFAYFYKKEMPVNLMLILSREEERSGPDGTQYLFSEGFLRESPDFPLPDWVIVGEPTGMRAATSERGLLVLDGTAAGVAGHAARGEGVNALYKAMDDIQALRNFHFDRISPLMGEVRLNVTQLEAGTAHNVIPDTCRYVVDIRPTEQYDNAGILAMLQKVCKNSELKARNLKNKSSATPAGSPLLKTAQALGLETFSSPTTSDWIRIDGDCIKMGPGDSARSHHADEYIKVSEIEEAIGLYIRFIETFYGNTLE